MHVVHGGPVGEADGAYILQIAVSVCLKEPLSRLEDPGDRGPLPDADGDGLLVEDLGVTAFDAWRLSEDFLCVVGVVHNIYVLAEDGVVLVAELDYPGLMAAAVTPHVADDRPNLCGEAGVPGVGPRDAPEIGEYDLVPLPVEVGFRRMSPEEVVDRQLLRVGFLGHPVPHILDYLLTLRGGGVLEYLRQHGLDLEDLDALVSEYLG